MTSVKIKITGTSDFGSSNIGLDELQVNAPLAPTYSWTPSSTLSNASILNPVATPTTDTEYTLTVSSNGCTASDKVMVFVNGALPVTLMYFNGYKYGDRNNLLVWKTATEHSCHYFNVMHSLDGEFWEKIGTIEGSGNSTIPIEYEMIHMKVSPVLNYYKLQQYDFDGAYETFDVISIDNTFSSKKISKIYNLLGQEVNWDASGEVIILYEDGSTEIIIK